MQPIATEKGISLSGDVASATVFTDKQLLLSVMQNLVSNALRYTESGGDVRIKTGAIPDQQDSILVSVIDTGVGIAEEHLANIFNEFYQIKSRGRENSRGLGLGLSIVKRISRLLNLQVSVLSVPGEGSTFSFRVPTAVTQELELPQTSPAMCFTPDRLNGISVLCLDNDDSVLKAMRTLLEGWGCIVTSVATYRQGCQSLRADEYNVVLADYRLDYDETGLDFLTLLKVPEFADKTNKTKGVLITAEQQKQLKFQAEDAGFHYLEKPIEPAALKSLLLYLVTESATLN